MTKEYSDRELVEYLDESVECWHEWWGNGSCCIKCGVKRALDLSNDSPTPTLEWMLGKLRKKKISIKFYPITNYKHINYGYVICEIYRKANDSYRVDEVTEAENEALALRGAVCKMIESEEK